MTRTTLALIALGSLFVAFAGNASSSEVPRRDPAEDAIREARKYAGPGAVDCGRARAPHADALDRCMANALVARRAFFGVLEEQGIDSAVGRSYAATASGTVMQFHYDSDPSGGGHAAPTLTQWPCAHPKVEGAGVDRVIRCKGDGRVREDDGFSAVYK